MNHFGHTYGTGKQRYELENVISVDKIILLLSGMVLSEFNILNKLHPFTCHTGKAEGDEAWNVIPGIERISWYARRCSSPMAHQYAGQWI